MTTASNDPSPSRLELVVLARMSCPKPPSEKALVQDVAKLALPAEPPERAREVVLRALGALRDRGWVNKPRRSLTDKGEHQLRKALELAQTPKWDRVRDEHLAALELGLRPATDEARKALTDAETLAVAVLRRAAKIPKAANLTALCDALIAEALGLSPGKITLRRIRAHVLARHANLEPRGSLPQIAVRAAAAALGEPRGTKRLFGRALARRWAYAAAVSEPATLTSRGAAVQPALPWSPMPPAPVVRLPDSASSTPSPASGDTLLTVVREAIPRIGSDGRFGAEKVFVSAIWHRIERDSRLPNLSLDRFKRWLVTANREQLVDLARADLVGAMDPKLVAESEIEDLGATFHFVVDRRASASAGGLHAR